MFVGYTKYHEGDCYDMLHPPSRNIYQIRDVTWLKRMYYQKESDEDNEDSFPFPKGDDNNNYEQNYGSKVDIRDTYGNQSDNEDKIMSEDEDADHDIIDRESVNCTTTSRSVRVVIPPASLK